MVKAIQLLILLASDQAGQDLIEYALLASLIGLAATAGLKNIATALASVFSSLNSALMSTI